MGKGSGKMLVGIVVLAGLVGVAADGDPADLVDTRIGTAREFGSCVVGPCVPNGSVHPSPDSEWPSSRPHAPGANPRHGRGAPTSGWWPGDRVVGFSQLHCQGTGGAPSYGQFRVIFGEPSDMEILESHPYRFRCRLVQAGVTVALAPTAHGAIYRHDAREVRVDHLCKLARAKASKDAVLTREGEVISGGGTYFGNWNPAPFGCWFYATDRAGEFRIAVSFKSVGQAKAYHDAELEGRDLDRIAAEARARWSRILGRVRPNGIPSEERRRFYTHLMHCFVQPRDRSGDGIGWDDYYTLWDTWRTVFPLMALLSPESVAANVNAFADRFEREGRCESCRTQGKEYKVGQGGDEADCVIADAWAKNVPGIDWPRVRKLLASRWDGRTRGYRERGYVPQGEKGTGYCRRLKSGSATMSFAYQDWCAGQVLGDARFLARSHNWTNLWNAAACDPKGGFRGFAEGRREDGTFSACGPRGGYNKDFYEATSWEYSFFAPHDMELLMTLCGGREGFVRRLEYAFENRLVRFDNEPAFQMPWLFAFADRGDLCAKWSREMERMFPADGCPGDDDAGAMASLYVFLKLGFFPISGRDVYALHGCRYPEVVLDLPGARHPLVIRSVQKSEEDSFVAVFNGNRIESPFITHRQFLEGGTLEFRSGE